VAENPAIAHSPIRAEGPVAVRAGWEVSTLRSYSALRLADDSALAKVSVRASPRGRVATRIGVPFGSAARDDRGTLVIGSGPGEWFLLGDIGTAVEIADRLDRDDDGLVSVVDITHGRALMRLSGAAAADLLSKVCAVDLAERMTPNGSAFRSSVAKLTTDVIRDDVGTTPSYVLHCERSSGQYLFDALLDAGAELGIGRDGSDPSEL
jgi:sarcosine oxidase subunit alpha